MHEMTEEAFSEQWLIAEGFEDDSTMASENRASVDVEKDAVRNALVNAFSSAKKVQEFYKGCFYMDINFVFIFKTRTKIRHDKFSNDYKFKTVKIHTGSQEDKNKLKTTVFPMHFE